MNASNLLRRCFLCAVALLAVFGGWYVADPQLATFQGADPNNNYALANMPVYRLVVYTTYIAAVVITWVCTTPTRPKGA